MGRLGCWVACRLWDCDRASSWPGGSAGAVGLLAWVGVRGCRGAARECRWRGGLLDALRCAGPCVWEQGGAAWEARVCLGLMI